VVDTIMVGHLPQPAVTISAVALGQVLYNTIGFGIGGVLLGLDTYISQAHGAGEWDSANRWLLHGLVLSLILSAVPMTIARWFTHDTAVVAAAAPLLIVGGAFQFFDGVQVTATGVLRGGGITKPGLAAHLMGYWVIGLPVGLWLGFTRNWGAVGLWVGLASGLMVAAIGLTGVWVRALGRGIGVRTV
jgi:Na+-driven multidrug efflux pump